MSAPPTRYTTVAIALHWAIAICIISMIPMGLWMTDAIRNPETQALAYRVFQFHKSIGFLILALTVLRIVWRLIHPVPPLPAAMRPLEAFAARATHAAFYGLMLALPLSGWLYVSSGWAVGTDRALVVPTSWFGLFGVPNLPWIGDLAANLRRTIAFQSMGAHAMLAWTAVVLVALHAGAALKHQFIERDGVLSHMLPALDHGAAARAALPTSRQKWQDRCAGFGLVLIITAAAAIAATPLPLQTPQGHIARTNVAPAAPAQPAVETRDATSPAMPKQAGAWSIDLPASRINFTGTHSGNEFKGHFGKWRGEIWFDPENLAGSRASIQIETASATTGDATQEGALEGEEWLDFKGFTHAHFTAAAFRSLGGEKYEASGEVTIKGVRVAVLLPFSFVEKDGAATVKGQIQLDRSVFNIGMLSDADGSWVSPQIGVAIEVTARRKP